MTAQQSLVMEALQKFPDAPALTIARKLHKENPGVWDNLNACRTCVRRVLGQNGKQARIDIADTSNFRPARKPGQGWSDVIPVPSVQLPGWKPVLFTGPLKALVLSDVHIPYHCTQALEASLERGYKAGINFILLNGDICDHYRLSRFEQDPKERTFAEEVEAVKKFMTGLRQSFGPKCTIVYKHGNHEERFERFMMAKCPEFLDIKAFEWTKVMGLEENNVQLVKDKKPIQLGKLNVIHGHEYSFAISNPVNPARGFYLRAKVHVLGGHLHQSSQHSEKSLEEKVISAWSTGCLCEIHPKFRPINPWNQGAAIVEVFDDGAFAVDNFRIINGKVY